MTAIMEGVQRLGLDAFHEAARRLDFMAPLVSLLGEFRQGHIADRRRTREAAALATHLAAHFEAWDRVFGGGFPRCRFPRRTLSWESLRGERDAHLRRLLAASVPGHDAGRRLIVNPATVLGRHARALARAMPDYEVLGTDIDPWGERLYRPVLWLKYRRQANYRFERENVFEPDLARRPAAVTFFGACGPVTDGSMDYAIAVDAPFLLCRSCCHDNIGGNTRIVRRPTPINEFFAFKNWGFARLKRKKPGFYFADRYGPDAYPRSRAARTVMDTETILDVARNSVDSDICRSVIDLDRCLYLKERGYDVMYREELFFAHRPGSSDESADTVPAAADQDG